MPKTERHEFATDLVGMEIYSAHYRVDRAKNAVIGILAGISLILVCAVVCLALRPRVTRWVRVDTMGRAAEIQYSDLKFTPTEGMARTYLADWAKDRYTTLKDSFAKNYPQNYIFMSEALSRKYMAEDLKSKLIARVASGQVEQNDLTVENPVILSFTTEETKDGTIAKGTAIIEMVKVFSAQYSQHPRNEKWDVSVEFVINPAQVGKKSSEDPNYERVNPLGVVITAFHENRSL